MNFNWIVNLIRPVVVFYLVGSRRSPGRLTIHCLCVRSPCQTPEAINAYFALREDSKSLHFAVHGLDDTTQSAHIHVRVPLNFSDGRPFEPPIGPVFQQSSRVIEWRRRGTARGHPTGAKNLFLLPRPGACLQHGAPRSGSSSSATVKWVHPPDGIRPVTMFDISC